MATTFNLTLEQKEHLTSLNNSCCDLWDILDYFKSIRPKAYKRLLKHNANAMHLSDFSDTSEWWKHAVMDYTADELVLNVKNEILERCGIQ